MQNKNRIQDIASLYKIYNSINSGYQKKLNQVSFNNFLKSKSSIFLLSEPLPVGYLMAIFSYKEIDIISLSIDTNYRRRGFGKKLLLKLKEEARKKKVIKIFLEVSIENIAALALYERCNYNCIGRRKKYYNNSNRKIDANIMCLNLTY